MIKMRVKWKEYNSLPTYAQDEMLETGLRPEDIAREFDDEIKEGAEKYFKYNMQFSITGNGIKLLGTTKS